MCVCVCTGALPTLFIMCGWDEKSDPPSHQNLIKPKTKKTMYSINNTPQNYLDDIFFFNFFFSTFFLPLNFIRTEKTDSNERSSI